MPIRHSNIILPFIFSAHFSCHTRPVFLSLVHVSHATATHAATATATETTTNTDNDNNDSTAFATESESEQGPYPWIIHMKRL